MTADQPKRRRIRPWLVLAAGLLVLCGFWLFGTEGESVRKSRSLRIGMTEAEVHAVMGEPVSSWIQVQSFATKNEEWSFEVRQKVVRALRKLGFSRIGAPKYPVTVDYDSAHHVERISRSGETVEAQPGRSK